MFSKLKYPAIFIASLICSVRNRAPITKVLLPALLISLFFDLHGQSPAFSVFLIGDTGELRDSSGNFKILKQQIAEKPHSTVIFLGDNIYPNGLIERKYDRNSHEIIMGQLRMFTKFKGNVFFIPGNHDWANTRNFSRGKARLGNQERFIERWLKDSSTVTNRNFQTFLPSDGQPGPAQTNLYEGKLKVIFIDTQWFMYLGYKKPTPALEDSTRRFFVRLDQMLASAKENKQRVLVAGHHPVYTDGRHSVIRKSPGFIKRWKFQDMSGRIYSGLAHNLDSVFSKYPGMIYAAGHDHLLQYFRMNGNDYLVSGSGSKTTPFSKRFPFNPAQPHNDVTMYLEEGFYRVDYYEDGTVKIRLFFASGESIPIFPR